MRKSLEEISKSFDTDKSVSHGFLVRYERFFEPIRSRHVKVLELGVLRGGSLLMWHEYFQNGLVVGLDMNPCPLSTSPERIRFYQGKQNDASLLEKIVRECAPEGFDIIIDDASHIGVISRESFQILFSKYLKKGGYYVIEDWGTGYWNGWPDGREYSPVKGSSSLFSRCLRRVLKMMKVDVAVGQEGISYDPDFMVHNYGMVGFVKELIDEVAWRDLASDDRGGTQLEKRESMIREMCIYTGQVFLLK